jgi:hypothetical protein
MYELRDQPQVLAGSARESSTFTLPLGHPAPPRYVRDDIPSRPRSISQESQVKNDFSEWDTIFSFLAFGAQVLTAVLLLFALVKLVKFFWYL